MANKSVNVTITYVVKGDKDLAKIESTSKKADKATQNLTNSTKKYGNEVTKAGKEGTKALDNVESQLGKLNKGFGSAISAVKTFIAALAVREVVNMTLEMSKLSGTVEGVERAFARSIPNSKVLMAELQRATHGTVSEFQLMQTAIKAQNFGIPLKNLGTLLEFASAKAQQTGESVDYLVDSIITGIGRESPLILDNLQLRMQDLKKVMDETGGSLADAVGVVAQQQLVEMGGYVETAATKVERLAASWTKVKEEASKFFSDGKIVGFFQSVTDSIADYLEARREGLTISELEEKRNEEKSAQFQVEQFQNEKLIGQKEEDIKQTERQINKLLAQVYWYEKTLKTRKEQVESLKDEADAINERNKGLGTTLGAINKNDQATKDSLKVTEGAVESLEKEIRVRTRMVEILQEQLKALTDVNDDGGDQKGIIEKLEDDIKRLQEAVKKAPTFEIAEKLQDDLDSAKSLLDSFLARISNNLNDFKGASEEMGKSFENVSDKIVTSSDIILDRFFQPINTELKSTAQLADEASERMLAMINSLGNIKTTVPTIIPNDFADNLELAISDARDVLTNTGIDVLSTQIIDNAQVQVEAIGMEIEALRYFYDEQQRLAGDNQAAKDQLQLEEQRKTRKLQIEMAKKQKEANRFSVIIDTAAGIIKAFATLPVYAAIVQSAIIAAIGASQLAVINRTPIPKFAKGVIDLPGPGTGTSDSIPSMLSRGESVITAERTKNSKYVLNQVQAGKLDDRILKGLKLSNSGVTSVFDDSKIVKELRSLKDSQPDLIRRGHLIYEAKKQSETYSKIVRSKSMG